MINFTDLAQRSVAINPNDFRDFRKYVGAFRTRELVVHWTQEVIVNIARDACGIRTTSSPRVKLMSSLAFNPRFFSPCFGQIMDLVKYLAWQKIFSGDSTNLKIEKSRFFCIFAPPPFTLSHFPIISEHMKLQLKILTLNGRSTDKKNYKLFFLCDFFYLLFLVSPGNFVLFDQSTSRTTKIGNSIFRYKRPKRVVSALRVRKSSTNPRPRPTGRGRGKVLHFYKIFRRCCL